MRTPDEYEQLMKNFRATNSQKTLLTLAHVKLPVRARHSAPSMGSTPFSGARTAGNSRCTAAIKASRTGGTFSSMLPAKAMGGVHPRSLEARTQPPDYQPHQVRKVIALLPQYG